MTNRAVTASSVHASLEDIGYKYCDKHGKKLYWWMGPPKCPKCRDKGNPNLLPRSLVRKQPVTKPIRDSRSQRSQKRGGQVTGGAKKGMLNDEQVIRLRDRYWLNGETLGPLAREFGTTPTTVSHAVRGIFAYEHVEYMPDQTRRPTEKRTNVVKFTPDQVRAIRKRYAGGESYDELALAYDRAKATISDICNRRTWKNV